MKKNITNDFHKGHEHILVVDDEEMILKVVKMILTQLGYTVTCESEPLKALSVFQSNPFEFDLVITDVNMPGIRGDELAQRLMAVRPGIPIIIYTGHSDAVDEKTCAQTGARAFLKKPFDFFSFASHIRHVLDDRSFSLNEYHTVTEREDG